MYVNKMFGEDLTLSCFEPGQRILYQVCEPPYEHVKTYQGSVKEIHEDYLIADIPRISDHCRFEEGFNLQFLYVEPLSDNELLAYDIWKKFYDRNPQLTREDKDRMMSELVDELDNGGENVFMLRQILSDMVNKFSDIYLYKGDVTEGAWLELTKVLGEGTEDLKDNIRIRGILTDGWVKKTAK